MKGDRDFKLTGRQIVDIFDLEHNINNPIVPSSISGAPTSTQNQNGIIESHWIQKMNLTKNSLTNHLLP